MWWKVEFNNSMLIKDLIRWHPWRHYRYYCMWIPKGKCTNHRFYSIFGVWCHIQQYFSYITATSFRGGRSRSTRREPPTMGKQRVNLRVECTHFCNLQSQAQTHAVLYKSLINVDISLSSPLLAFHWILNQLCHRHISEIKLKKNIFINLIISILN